MVLELRLAPDTRACLIPAVTSTCSLFRSVRLGRCRTRQLRDHRSRAAQESTRWGCEPQTLGPRSQRQGFYTDRLLGESTPLPHESVGVLIQVRRKLMRKSTWPSPRRAPGCQQLRRRELRPEFPRGGVGGAVAEVPVYPLIAQLHSTAPQPIHADKRYASRRLVLHGKKRFSSM